MILIIYLKESIPGITRVTMITFVSLVGITAMAGAIERGRARATLPSATAIRWDIRT